MTLYGPDVSAFQEGFNFLRNRPQCPFVMIKQTEGLTWPEGNDTHATETLRQMRRDAIAARYVWIGLYHFARPRPGRTGTQEAEHFLSFVGPLEPNEGVVLDLEEANDLSPEELQMFAIEFVDRIEAAYPSLKGKVIFYSYPAVLGYMRTDRIVGRCPLWIAAYGRDDGREHSEALELDRWKEYTFWQYTSRGNAEGYSGFLDMNRYDGDEASLAALGAGSQSQPPSSGPAPDQPRWQAEQWHGEYLRRGSSGIRVIQIQQRLKARGWDIEVDGQFGRATDTIVRKFQEEKGLEVDGVIGQETWDAMYAFFDGVDVVPPPVPQPEPLPPEPDREPDDVFHPDPAGQCAAWGFDGNSGHDPVREFQRAFAFYPIAVDGDAGPQTARAVQVVIDKGLRLSDHFTIAELACRHCGRIRFLRETLEAMEGIRGVVGPFTPVSAYRCPTHNANIGGAELSQHVQGAACDMDIPLEVAESVGLSGIGTCGDRCLHGDRRDASGFNTTGATQENPTYWSYC